MLKPSNKLPFSIAEQEYIFDLYFGGFEYGRAYSSFFEEYENHSTGFYISPKQEVIYNDFRTEEKLTCVDFIMKHQSISKNDALKKARDLLSGIDIESLPPRKVYEKYKFIGFVPKPFSPKELHYWKEYYITAKELRQNNVYSIKELYVNKKLHKIPSNILKFGFTTMYEEETYVKVYSPGSQIKAFGNIPLHVPFMDEGVEDGGKNLFITKSMKDKMVLKKFCKNVISLQNESLAAFDDERLLPICEKYENVYLNFDADIPGRKATSKFLEKHKFIDFSIPEDIYTRHNTKDISDFIKKFGIVKTQNLLTYINKKIHD